MDPFGVCQQTSLRGIKHFKVSKFSKSTYSIGFLKVKYTFPNTKLGPAGLGRKGWHWTPKGHCACLPAVNLKFLITTRLFSNFRKKKPPTC